MFDVLTEGEARLARWLGFAGAVALVGMVMSHFWILFNREASGAWTDAANRGSTNYPIEVGLGPASDDIYTTSASLLGLVTIGSIAWLLFHGSAWVPKALVALMGVLGLTVATGTRLRFRAVRLGDTFDRDLRGYSFVLDPDLQEVIAARGVLGSMGGVTFRVLFVANLLCTAVVIALVIGLVLAMMPRGARAQRRR